MLAEEFLSTLRDRAELHLGTVDVAVVDKSGRCLLSNRADPVEQSSNSAVTQRDAIWMYSFTKLITTICALQCVERGLIKLDEDVSRILPELDMGQIISQCEREPRFVLTPRKNHVTLRQLLTHTSGFRYDALHPALLAWRQSRGEGPLTMSGRVKEAHSVPLVFEPGEGWTYGGGLDWTGILVGRLSGKSFEQYIQTNICEVLGMPDTTFFLSAKPGLRERIVEMKIRTPNGLISGTSPYNWDAPEESGGMGLISTVADFTKVLIDLIQDSPRLLSRASIKEMHTPQLKSGSEAHEAFLQNAEEFKDVTGAINPSSDVNYGLGGLIVGGSGTQHQQAGSLTWHAMPNGAWFLNRDKGIAGVYAGQFLPPADSQHMDMIGKFFEVANSYGRESK